jgi:hypothetical protein
VKAGGKQDVVPPEDRTLHNHQCEDPKSYKNHHAGVHISLKVAYSKILEMDVDVISNRLLQR